MTEYLQLEQEWTVIGPIGDQPGMSSVFEVERGGERAVIKKVTKVEGGNRDLLAEDIRGCRNVVPLDEVYATESELLLRMPKAEYSLNHLLSLKGRLEEADVIAVLTDVATALLDMGSLVVHRDIKPENILWYRSRWCLADFGIARYVEETTSTLTYKGYASKQWTAPERWRNERATIKSDVYSLGIVAYQLLMGELPFRGPDFSEQHRNSPLPPLPTTSPLLRSLVLAMASKAPESRPRPDEILSRLEAASRVVSSSAVNRLRELAAQSAEQEARRDAAAAEAKTKQERRQVIAQSALHLAREWLDPITEALDAIPAVRRTESGNELQFHFEKGLLVLEKPQEVQPISELPFDLVVGGAIRVEMPAIDDRWAGRSHCLWYCDAQNEGEYFWFETAFHSMTKTWRLEPYTRSPHERDTQLALQRVMHTEQVARPFRPLVGAELEAFVERWLDRFAQAAEGELPRPLVMPEGSPAGTWRN